MAIFNSYVSLPEGIQIHPNTQPAFGGWNSSLVSSMQKMRRWVMFPPDVPAESIGASLGSMDGTVGENPDKTETSMWVCLKIGYIPNDSHLIGIMIINHWV